MWRPGTFTKLAWHQLNNPNQHKISKPNSKFHSNKNNNTLERIKSIHRSFIKTVLNEQNIPKFIY